MSGGACVVCADTLGCGERCTAVNPSGGRERKRSVGRAHGGGRVLCLVSSNLRSTYLRDVCMYRTTAQIYTHVHARFRASRGITKTEEDFQRKVQLRVVRALGKTGNVRE